MLGMSIVSAPDSPDICPTKSVPSSIMRVPVDPAKVTFCTSVTIRDVYDCAQPNGNRDARQRCSYCIAVRRTQHRVRIRRSNIAIIITQREFGQWIFRSVRRTKKFGRIRRSRIGNIIRRSVFKEHLLSDGLFTQESPLQLQCTLKFSADAAMVFSV